MKLKKETAAVDETETKTDSKSNGSLVGEGGLGLSPEAAL